MIQDLMYSDCLLDRNDLWITPRNALILPKQFITNIASNDGPKDALVLHRQYEATPQHAVVLHGTDSTPGGSHGHTPSPAAGTPFFPEEDLRFLGSGFWSYLAPDYSTPARMRVLHALGCKTFGPDQIREIVSHREFHFTTKSTEWIARFFQFLEEWKLRPSDTLLTLPFLKVASGTWMKKAANVVIQMPNLPLPPQVSLQALDPEFVATLRKNHHAFNFLTNVLGVREATHVVIVDRILYAQKNVLRSNPAVLEAHARYLSSHWPKFREQLSPHSRARLVQEFKFLDSNWNHGTAKDMTQNTQLDTGTGSKYRLVDIQSSRVRILNRLYGDLFSDFIQTFSIRALPPLRSRYELNDFYRRDLAPSETGDNRLLTVLMEPQLWDGVPSSMAQDCGKIGVMCRNGLKPLKSCYIATQELAPLLTDDMNVLVVADPDSSKWHRLAGMGVTFEPDAKLFVDQLMRLKKTFQSSDMTRVDSIYQSLVKHLQGGTNKDREFVRYQCLFPF
jgi:hypothetical protein